MDGGDDGQAGYDMEQDETGRKTAIIRGGWALYINGVRLTRRLDIFGAKKYCILIPAVYPKGCVTFDAFDRTNRFANFYIAALEIWLLTLDVIQRRVNAEGGSISADAVAVFLECVRKRADPTQIREHRLHIVTQPGFDIGTVYGEVLTNMHYPLSREGQFMKPTNESQTAPVINVAEGPVTVYELYKRMSLSTNVAVMYDVITNSRRVMSNIGALNSPNPIAHAEHPLNPDGTFTLRNAMRPSSQHVAEMQASEEHYRGDPSQSPQPLLVFRDYQVVIRVQMPYWNIRSFMTRLFPCEQLSIVDDRWRATIAKLRAETVTISPFRFGEAAATVAARARVVGLLEDGASSSALNGDVEIGNGGVIGNAAAAGGIGGLDQADTGAGVGGGEADLAVANDVNAAQMEVRMMTPDEIEDHNRLMWHADNRQSVTKKLDDVITELQAEMAADEFDIRQRYRDEPDERAIMLNTMRAVYWERLARHITGEKAHVSETQQKLNKLWHDRDLAAKQWTLPVIDPNKSALDNAIISMMTRFAVDEGVATQQMTCVFLFMALGDVFNADFDVHLNIYLYGDNGAGKSFCSKLVLQHFGWDCVQSVTGESRLANSVQGNSYDNVYYNDDTNISHLFKPGDKLNADKCHDMATQMNTRYVLELEKNADGTTKRVRKMYQNIEVKVDVWVGNEDAGEMAAAISGRSGNGNVSALHALLSRFVLVNMSWGENQLRNIDDYRGLQDSAAQQAFRDESVRFNTARGWYQKAERLGLVKFNNMVFEEMFPLYMGELKKLGFNSDDNRVQYKAWRLCRQLIIYEQYVIHHCLPSGQFYGKRFKFQMMAQWIPVCYTHHVVIVFSRFAHCFVPPALDFVLTAFRKKLKMAIEGRARIPQAFFACKRPRRETSDRTLAALAAALGGNSGATGGAGGGGGGRGGSGSGARAQGQHDLQLVAPRLAGGGHPSDSVAAAIAAAASAGNAGRGGGGGDDEDGEGEEDLDASYVSFQGTLESLTHELEVLSKTQSLTFSRSCIGECLRVLYNMPVWSHPFVFLHASNPWPVMDDKVPIGYQGVALKVERGFVSIHYALLTDDTDYGNLVRTIPRRFCYDNTISQELLLYIPNSKFPWIPEETKLERVPGRHMMVKNPRRLDQYELMSGMGKISYNTMPPETRKVFKRYHSDIDTVALMAYVASIAPPGQIEHEDVLDLHPAEAMNHLSKYFQYCHEHDIPNPVTGEPYRFLKYPQDALAELESRAAIIRAHKADDVEPDSRYVGDGAMMSNRVFALTPDAQRRATEQIEASKGDRAGVNETMLLDTRGTACDSGGDIVIAQRTPDAIEAAGDARDLIVREAPRGAGRDTRRKMYTVIDGFAPVDIENRNVALPPTVAERQATIGQPVARIGAPPMLVPPDSAIPGAAGEDPARLDDAFDDGLFDENNELLLEMARRGANDPDFLNVVGLPPVARKRTHAEMVDGDDAGDDAGADGDAYDEDDAAQMALFTKQRRITAREAGMPGDAASDDNNNDDDADEDGE